MATHEIIFLRVKITITGKSYKHNEARFNHSISLRYSRLEVLSGFVNGLFSAVIAINVFAEGVRRLFDPPNVGTDRLFAVSVAGLVVNLIGIAAFSCGGGSHSHGGGGGHSHNANMRGK